MMGVVVWSVGVSGSGKHGGNNLKFKLREAQRRKDSFLWCGGESALASCVLIL
jgi:hypothetical protein